MSTKQQLRADLEQARAQLQMNAILGSHAPQLRDQISGPRTEYGIRFDDGDGTVEYRECGNLAVALMAVDAHDRHRAAGSVAWDTVEAVSRTVIATPWTTVPAGGPAPRPQVVVLCGSTRFRDDFHAATRQFTLDGCIVLAPGVFGHAEGIQPTDAQKAALDALHLRKIDLADRVFVVNPGGYVGESTRREIAYAAKAGKPIDYLCRPASQGKGQPA